MADELGKSPSGRIKVVVFGYGLDGTDVGEVYSASQMVKALSRHASVTLLTTDRRGRKPVSEQQTEARVVSWKEPVFLAERFERISAQFKPALPFFFAKAARWLRAAMDSGEEFDIAHQIVPQAMRYASPLRKLGLPYVIGPLGGSLSTPRAFQAEMSRSPLMTRLRALDGMRLAYDPWLRASYRRAGLVLGVAPYVDEALKTIGIRRFEAFAERADDGSVPAVRRNAASGQLKLVHVGRAVRTKGLRDMVRAMAHLKDLPGITLTSAGEGEDLAACREEAERLGVAGRIDFRGKIPRADVDKLYRDSDVFAFPSFREPMGGVLFEAMGWGLPVIAAARGGPEFIIDETCGFRIPVTTPDQYPRDIAAAVRTLFQDPALRLRLGKGARARLAGFGTWDDKALRLVQLYRETIADHAARRSGS